MKFSVFKLIISTVMMFFSVQSFANKLLIISDELNKTTSNKANQIRSLIKTTAPFTFLKTSEFQISILQIDQKNTPILCKPHKVQYTDEEIKSLVYWSKQSGIIMSDADIKKFKDGYTINRLVECESEKLALIGAKNGADHILFVHESPYEGGSGGSIPVILSSSRPGIGLHEWIHTFGFGDEYAYPSNEAPFHCRTDHTPWFNIGIFQDAPPYLSNTDAAAKHENQIPWFDALPTGATLVTAQQLISPYGRLGIFPSKTCSQTIPLVKSWKSTGYPTIMEDVQTNYIPKTFWKPFFNRFNLTPARIKELMNVTVKPNWLKPTAISPNPPSH